LWFRRDRLAIVSPAREPSRPLSGRNATYPPVRIRRASSALYPKLRIEVVHGGIMIRPCDRLPISAD
jgi:hypothetical protein